MPNYLNCKNNNKSVEVAFIIVSFNTKELLENLLSFFEVSNMPFSYSITVIDNKSSDGSIELLNNKKNITVIQNSENMGYARAVNQGVAIAESKYICILNTDLILNEEALTATWNYMEKNPPVGVCAPVIYYPAGRVQGFFFKFNIFFLYSDFIKKIYLKFKKAAILLSKSPVKVDGITGAFIFLRTSVIENNKLFDEDFFFYYEDTDLAHRLKTRNITTIILPSCKIIHIGGQSSIGKNWKLFYQNKYLYIKKHYGKIHAKNIYIIDFLKAKIKAPIYKILSITYPTKRVRLKSNFYNELSKNLKTLLSKTT